MYVVCAAGSYYYLRVLKRTGNRPKVLLWRCIFALILLLGINKQLDFQTLLSNVGRAISSAQGWFEHRRLVQGGFAAVLMVSALTFAGVILYKTRSVLRRSILELSGVGVLILFTLIRTSALTHLGDRWRLDDIPRIHAMELLGLLLLASAIALGLRKHKQQTQEL